MRHLVLYRKTAEEEVVVDPIDRTMITHSVRAGTYKQSKIPPELFQRYMSDMLSGKNGWESFFYDDDRSIRNDPL